MTLFIKNKTFCSFCFGKPGFYQTILEKWSKYGPNDQLKSYGPYEGRNDLKKKVWFDKHL